MNHKFHSLLYNWWHGNIKPTYCFVIRSFLKKWNVLICIDTFRPQMYDGRMDGWMRREKMTFVEHILCLKHSS